MSYSVKEIFYTLQGEGIQAGRAAVFCRFSGCNLWSGRAVDRDQATCSFCDTDFVGTDGTGGGYFASASELAERIAALWPERKSSEGRASRPYVVCTGGEPLLQLDEELIQALHAYGFEVGVETNGTRMPPPGLDWLCVSPKGGTELAIRSGSELKLVFPQTKAPPDLYETLDFQYFLLQPLDGPEFQANTQLALRYCLEHPQWRLSLQLHKVLRIP